MGAEAAATLAALEDEHDRYGIPQKQNPAARAEARMAAVRVLAKLGPEGLADQADAVGAFVKDKGPGPPGAVKHP
jgi:hypothetical protein